MAKALLKEWHEYRREQQKEQKEERSQQGEGNQQQEQSQQEQEEEWKEQSRPRGIKAAELLELRAQTMRTLYPRLQKELKALLPVPGDRGGGFSSGEWSGGGGSGEGWASESGEGGW